jgi:hypothetical protein
LYVWLSTGTMKAHFLYVKPKPFRGTFTLQCIEILCVLIVVVAAVVVLLVVRVIKPAFSI